MFLREMLIIGTYRNFSFILKYNGQSIQKYDDFKVNYKEMLPFNFIKLIKNSNDAYTL